MDRVKERVFYYDEEIRNKDVKICIVVFEDVDRNKWLSEFLQKTIEDVDIQYGISIRNPNDTYDDHIAKKVAYGRATHDTKAFDIAEIDKLFVHKGFIDTLKDTIVLDINRNPKKYSVHL